MSSFRYSYKFVVLQMFWTNQLKYMRDVVQSLIKEDQYLVFTVIPNNNSGDNQVSSIYYMYMELFSRYDHIKL